MSTTSSMPPRTTLPARCGTRSRDRPSSSTSGSDSPASFPAVPTEDVMHRPILIGTLALAAVAAHAQQQPSAGGAAVVASAPGTATVAAAVKVTAIVQAVDKANRLVTL